MPSSSKLITLQILEYFKGKLDTVISEGDAKSFKAVDYTNNTLKFYKTEEKSDSPVEIALPEEMFLDQAKTAFVENFAWSEETYPGSTNPSLDGKPVMVLAVKGDTSTSYSFVNLERLVDVYTGAETTTNTVTVADGSIKVDAKISAETGNILETKTDGLYVPEAAEMTYATTEDIDALF